MASKFDHFADALQALCKLHHVVIAPTPGGHIGDWEAGESDSLVDGLQDWIGTPEPWDMPPCDLPSYFMSIYAAAQFPGYVGHETTLSQASTRAASHAGSDIVPIGPPKQVRSWAVIRR